MYVEDEVQIYSENEWAVKRWDWFHRGEKKEPHSFCQFWRTVLLWATLAIVMPFIRPLTDEEKLRRFRIRVDRYTRQQVEEKKPSKVFINAKLVFQRLFLYVGVFAYILIWPFRLIGKSIVWAIGSGSDMAEKHRSGLVRLGNMLLLLALIIVALCVTYLAIVLVTVVIPWLLHVHINIFKLILWIGITTVVMIATIYVGFRWVMPVMWAFLTVLFEVFMMLFEAAKAGHHKICPPMEIQRR